MKVDEVAGPSTAVRKKKNEVKATVRRGTRKRVKVVGTKLMLLKRRILIERRRLKL